MGSLDGRPGAGRAARLPAPARPAVAAAGLAALSLAWAGTATLAYASLVERSAYVLREGEALVLPPGSAPLRVLHLSDFHLIPWQRQKVRWVAQLAELEPDLIVNTGDNVGHAEALPALRRMLAPFRGIPGVVVHGSNDFFGPVFKNPLSYLLPRARKKRFAPRLDAESMDRLLEDELGWVPLDNRAADVVVNGIRMRWLGLGDPHIRSDSPNLALAALMELDASGPAPDLRLGAVHAPYRRAVDLLVRHGAALVFAGHTHGGQVCVPGYGPIVANCDLPPAHAKGMSAWDVADGGDAYPDGEALGPGPAPADVAIALDGAVDPEDVAPGASAAAAATHASDAPVALGAPVAASRREAARSRRGARRAPWVTAPSAGSARLEGLLHVSGGLGTSAFAPFRLAARPEATLLTLLPREA